MSSEDRKKPLKYGATEPGGFRKEGEVEGGKWLETRGVARKSRGMVPEKILIYISGKGSSYLPGCTCG